MVAITNPDSITNPLVTVLITAYNNIDYLNKAVMSADNQDYSPLEILIVDDGSNPPLLEKIVSTRNDIIYIFMKHKGVPHGLIKGVEESSGKYIAILDHDDMLKERSISSRVEALEKDSSLAFSYGNISYIDEKGENYGDHKFREYNNRAEFIRDIIVKPVGPIKHGAVLFRKDILNQVGNYDTKLSSFYDSDLIIRLAKNYDFVHIDDYVLNYRTHRNNTTKKFSYRISSMKERFRLIDENFEGVSKKINYKTRIITITAFKVLYELFFIKRHRFIIDMLK